MLNFIIGVILLFSLNSWAGYIPGSKINSCGRTDYSSKEVCESSEGESCHLETLGECGIYKLTDVLGDDNSKPIYSKNQVESCSDDTDCQYKLQNLVCVIQGESAIKNLDLMEVYCAGLTGYEQKVISQLLEIDPALKAQKDALKLQASQINSLIENGKKAREACQRVLDLIGGFNLLPGRSTEQAGQMVQSFEEAKQHLQDGRPGAAKIAIQAIPVDGVLVTQQMKDLALAQLQGY